jgi:uncharacterized protein
LKKETYKLIENYMLSCMTDSAHDTQHIYRVLYTALDIACHEKDVNTDILITACLLHDIGREKQYADSLVCHAAAGAEMAYGFLINNGFPEEYASHVKACIYTHRFRNNDPPASIEAKILFDADKLDVAGVMGIARTLLYKGKLSNPLYSVDDNGNIIEGLVDTNDSLFHEYNFKLKNIYDKFYTKRGARLAKQRRRSAEALYKSLYSEVLFSLSRQNLLQNYIGE